MPLAVHLLGLTLALGQATPDPTALARRIDDHLDRAWRAEKVEPAPPADDAEFLRRAYLDLTGRVPRPNDVHTFLADKREHKRRELIDRLLGTPRFAHHMANVWRAELLPEASAGGGTRLLQTGFEAWLHKRFREEARFDELVRELLTVPIAATGKESTPVLRDPERPNPLAFYAAKEAKPENLAAAVTRSFLGVRLECAQCHDHPFARWKQDQFWKQAAFFAGIRRTGPGQFASLNENADRRELTPAYAKGPLTAEFLDETAPAWKPGRSARAVFAEWVTSPENPFFARATANRVWGHFFGRGLVDPVDDFRDDNPASHPELLDDLAKALVEAKFDLTHLMKAIGRSRAYQRTSARTHPSQDKSALPARMPVKALTGEQLFDSLALATGYRDDQDKGAARRQFLTRFSLTGAASEPETSVQQALTLLNGRFVEWATDPEACPTLIAATQTPGLSVAERIEALYVATLSRKPTGPELSRLVRYIEGGRQAERLADVFWTLLNAAEFRMNH